MLNAIGIGEGRMAVKESVMAVGWQQPNVFKSTASASSDYSLVNRRIASDDAMVSDEAFDERARAIADVATQSEIEEHVAEPRRKDGVDIIGDLNHFLLVTGLSPFRWATPQ